MKYVAIFGLALAAGFSACAQGYIVPNGVVTNLFPGEIDVWNTGPDINGFLLIPFGKSQPTVYTNVFSFTEPVTIGVRVFLVSPNDPLSLQQIQSLAYPELQYPNNYKFAAGTPFYVGLYTGAEFAPPFPPMPPYFYTDPVFGWAELESMQGTIEVLDSALEYQGGGIIVGTLDIIPAPEPGTVGLICLGGLLLGMNRWRRKMLKC